MSHIRGGEKRPDRADKVLPKAEEGGDKKKNGQQLSCFCCPNGDTRRGRARLCGGEHREEAQQKGLSSCTFTCVFFLFISSLFVERSDDGALVRKVALRS